jgi:inosine-uridine nucleoside N-ribohydrolase
MESEYMAVFEAAQTAEALRNLLQHLGEQQGSPTPIHVDNTACQLIANPHSYTKRSRHIHVKFHYTREAIEREIITLIRVSSERRFYPRPGA